MLDPKTRKSLGFRPNIVRIEPRSLPVTPNVKKSLDAVAEKETRVNKLINDLKAVAVSAAGVEEVIHKKAKDIVVKLDFNNPEDVIVGQAAARLFPDQATEVSGLKLLDRITYPMYKECLLKVKDAGFKGATKNQIKQNKFDAKKVNFGALDKDRRPQINNSSLPFEPLDLTAFVAGVIPALFALLFPLISGTVKANIIGHTHPVVVPPAIAPIPSGPGISVIP